MVYIATIKDSQGTDITVALEHTSNYLQQINYAIYSGEKCNKVMLYSGQQLPILNWRQIYLATSEPIVIEQQSDGVFTPIKSRSLTLNIVNDKALLDLYSNTAKGVKVRVWNNNGKTLFYGYVTPNSFAQPYSHIWDDITVECVDALSALKYYKYETRDFAKWLDIIGKCLLKTDFYTTFFLPENYILEGQGIRYFGNEVWPLLYINEGNFYGNDEEETPWTYYQVLEEFCRAFGLTLTTYHDKLFFTDYYNKVKNPSDLMAQYIITGDTVVYTTSAVITDEKTLADESGAYINYRGEGLNIDLDATYNKITVSDDLYIKETEIDLEDLFNEKDLVALTQQHEGKMGDLNEVWVENVNRLIFPTMYDASGGTYVYKYVYNKNNKLVENQNILYNSGYTTADLNADKLYNTTYDLLSAITTAGIIQLSPTKTINAPFALHTDISAADYTTTPTLLQYMRHDSENIPTNLTLDNYLYIPPQTLIENTARTYKMATFPRIGTSLTLKSKGSGVFMTGDALLFDWSGTLLFGNVFNTIVRPINYTPSGVLFDKYSINVAISITNGQGTYYYVPSQSDWLKYEDIPNAQYTYTAPLPLAAQWENYLNRGVLCELPTDVWSGTDRKRDNDQVQATNQVNYTCKLAPLGDGGVKIPITRNLGSGTLKVEIVCAHIGAQNAALLDKFTVTHTTPISTQINDSEEDVITTNTIATDYINDLTTVELKVTTQPPYKPLSLSSVWTAAQPTFNNYLTNEFADNIFTDDGTTLEDLIVRRYSNHYNKQRLILNCATTDNYTPYSTVRVPAFNNSSELHPNTFIVDAYTWDLKENIRSTKLVELTDDGEQLAVAVENYTRAKISRDKFKH